MRCLECGNTQRKTNQRCWQEWQLCGKCAPLKYPEMYVPHQGNKQGKILSRKVTKKITLIFNSIE